MLCMSTSQQVFHTPFAGPNHLKSFASALKHFFFVTKERKKNGYYQHLGVTLKRTEKQIIVTREQHAEHQFAGRNTQEA